MTAKLPRNVGESGPQSAEMKVLDLQHERERLAGLVESLRLDRERLRQRVLDAARGHVCERCSEEARASKPPSPLVGPDAPPAAPSPVAEPPLQPARFDPSCPGCLGRSCDGLGAMPCAEHGGPVVARL